jgi:hypothetical protein
MEKHIEWYLVDETAAIYYWGETREECEQFYKDPANAEIIGTIEEDVGKLQIINDSEFIRRFIGEPL